MTQPRTTTVRSLRAKTRQISMLVLLISAISVLTCQLALAQQPREVFDQAVSDFQSGRIEESVAGFDRLVKLAPEALPQLWQRGIALYYAGRFKDCREQFESHRTENPNDVENAAWHFLCVARGESPAKAKAALLPVGPESRMPKSQIYEMLRGALTVDQVLRAGGTQPDGQFYAELYSGLYLEALGNAEGALKHIRNAATDRYSGSGYMHAVARVHRNRLVQRQSPAKP